MRYSQPLLTTDSGYFVPKSLDKKGIHEFLFDRAKRLLIPFVVYNFFFGTYVEYGEFCMLKMNASKLIYRP